MTKIFKCAETGVKCAWQGTAATVEELKAKIVAHAKDAHKIEQIPKEMMTKIEAAIKDI